jgi:signal transduction histidine kinase
MLSHWRDLCRRLQNQSCVVTSPHAQINDENLKRSARLLAAITLALIPLHVFVSIALYAVYGSATWSWKLVMVSGAVTAVVYILSRGRFIRMGVNLFIVEMITSAISLLYVNADAYSAVTSLLPIYFASMFRSLRRLILTAVVTIGAVFVVSRLIPGDWEEIYGVLILLIVTSMMIVIRSYLQWQAESELHLRNQQLADSEARFRAAIDASIGMFFLLKAVRGADGQIQDFILVDVNTRVAKGLQREYGMLVNQPISAVIPVVYQNELFVQCKRVVDSGTPINTEIRTLNRWWEYQAVPVMGGVAVIGFDITARKEVEKRQVELQIERERVAILQRFIRDVSHDLMTPLSIIGSSSYLAGKLEAQDQRDLHLRQIDEQTARLKNMFEEMLIQSRLDNLTSQDLDCQPIAMDQLLQKLVTSFENIAQRKSQRLIFQACERAAVTLVDKASMEIAIANIIDNALKYTPEAGTIRVSCECGQEDVIIRVEDNGSGIPVHEVDSVFERFYRVEAHRPLTGGSGLGLSITKKIIELHGGSIVAENRIEGGMRFSVSLRAQA